MSYQIARHKLWKNASRNMSGEIKSTFIGIFPKLELKFTPMTQARVAVVTALLDKSFITVKYYDPKHNAIRTAKFYSNDYKTQLLHKTKDLWLPIEVNLIATSKEV